MSTFFLDIENLTKDGEGYVYWKGVHVEHYSFRYEQATEERAAAEGLARRCQHLESIGIPVGSGTVTWRWDWYAGIKTREQLDNLTPLMRSIMLNPKDLYEDQSGRFAWIAESQGTPDSWKISARLCVCDRGEVSSTHINSDDLGGFYHPLRALGWNIAQMGQGKDQGCCYATTEQLLNWFDSKMSVSV